MLLTLLLDQVATLQVARLMLLLHQLLQQQQQQHHRNAAVVMVLVIGSRDVAVPGLDGCCQPFVALHGQIQPKWILYSVSNHQCLDIVESAAAGGDLHSAGCCKVPAACCLLNCLVLLAIVPPQVPESLGLCHQHHRLQGALPA